MKEQPQQSQQNDATKQKADSKDQQAENKNKIGRTESSVRYTQRDYSSRGAGSRSK